MSLNDVDKPFSRILQRLPSKNHDQSLGMGIRTLANRLINKGGKCPCCGRFGKVDGRSLTVDMTRALFWILDASGHKRRWVNVPKEAPRWVLRTKKLTQLKHWGFIEPMTKTDGRTKTSGIWRPTRKGRRFVEAAIRVPERMYVFDNRVLAEARRLITVQEALGTKYHYQEELERTWLGEHRQGKTTS